jgi:serine/threonine protein kinase/formylglycine-generating enzyme required for sulfatase activity/outer membrane protein assembly factor BamD (BamD/ComL family)
LEEDVSLGDIKTVSGRRNDDVFKDSGYTEPLTERYEIQEEIGRGGFAVVYKARDKKLGRTVAIKRLLTTTGDVGLQTLERFKREGRVIAGLNHRNVVGVFDVGEDDDGIYLVMEYIEGGNLRDFLKREGRLDLSKTFGLVRGMVQGLSYAHRKNLVHRDIKPANILLQEEGGELIPKIVDFGLAQAGQDSDLSLSGYGMGTPFYMPPEQRRNAKSVNHTADIYALGKVLYEMVTGELPDNVDPEMIPPPAKLSAIIFKCIKSKPEERYFSTEELLMDLESLGAMPSAPVATKARMQTASSCPACGAENSEDVRFCESCGGGLIRNCPECDRENSIHKQFCGGCGTDIEGFLNAQDILQRMQEYSEEKRWTRVLKEHGLLGRDTRLPGAKGAELRSSINALLATTEGVLQERNKIRAQLNEALDDEARLEEALDLVAAYQELDPHNAEVNELVGQLNEGVEDRDFRKAEKLAGTAEAAGDYEQAISVYRDFHEQYPEGRHAEEAWVRAEKELPAQIELHSYRQAVAKAELAAQASELEAAIDALREYLDQYPAGEYSDRIREQCEQELPERIQENYYENLKAQAEAAEKKENYEVAIEAYQAYLERYPDGKFAGQAMQKCNVELPDLLDGLTFRNAQANAEAALKESRFEEASGAYASYLESYPDGCHNDTARQQLDFVIPQKVDEQAFALAEAEACSLEESFRIPEAIELYRQYLETYPEGLYAETARHRIEKELPTKIDKADLRVAKVAADEAIANEEFEDAIAAYLAYAEKHPEGEFVQTALAMARDELPARMEERDFRRIKAVAEEYEAQDEFEKSIDEYRAFLSLYPQGHLKGEVGSLIAETLPEKILSRDFNVLMNRIHDLKQGWELARASWGEKIGKTEDALKLLREFSTKHSSSKYADVIEFETEHAKEKLRYFKDEGAFVEVVNLARAAIRNKKYDQASAAYRRYLRGYGNHREEIEQKLKVDIPKLVSEKKASRRKSTITASLSLACIVALVVLALGTWIGVSTARHKQKVSAFEEAVLHKHTSEASALAADLEGRYVTEPDLEALSDYVKARETFHQRLGAELQNLIEIGGGEARQLERLLLEIERPQGPEMAIDKYKEACRIAEGIINSNQELLDAKESYSKTVEGVAVEDFERLVPSEWAAVSNLVARAEETVNPEEKVKLWDQATTGAKEVAEVCRRELGYEAELTRIRAQFELERTGVLEADYAQYVHEEWAAVRAAEEKAVGASDDRQRSFGLWKIALQKITLAKQSYGNLRGEEGRMLDEKNNLVQELLRLVHEDYRDELQREYGRQSNPALLVKAMKKEYPASEWESILGQVEIAERHEGARRYVDAAKIYKATKDIISSLKGGTFLLLPQERYEYYCGLARDAANKLEWASADAKLELAINTGAPDTSAARKAKDELKDYLFRANPNLIEFNRLVAAVGEDKFKKYAPDKWANANTLLEQSETGETEQIADSGKMALETLREGAVGVYYPALVHAFENGAWKVCNEIFLQVAELGLVNVATDSSDSNVQFQLGEIGRMFKNMPKPQDSKEWMVVVGDGVEIVFAPVPAGSFKMGGGMFGPKEEKPRHKVSLAEPFWMSCSEVTQGQYRQVMEQMPSRFKGDNLPVESVSWGEAVEFCHRLTKREHDSGHLPLEFEYRLPTEAQWEYACRAESEDDYHHKDLFQVAWYGRNGSGKPHPVSSKKENGFGLHDMHGNVAEWCLDVWHPNYDGAPKNGTGFHDGDRSFRVVRGGSWNASEEECRSAARSHKPVDSHLDMVGFRPVMVKE